METSLDQSALIPSLPLSTRVVSQVAGRVRLRVVTQGRNINSMEEIAQNLQAHPQIKRVQTNVNTGSILIYHRAEEQDILAMLQDLGMLSIVQRASEIRESPSTAAASLTATVQELNQRVGLAAHGIVDLRFLLPLLLALLSLRQLRKQGVQLNLIPWYVLAWYAFDSFTKLNSTQAIRPTQGVGDQ